jgi:hypothetical protein
VIVQKVNVWKLPHSSDTQEKTGQRDGDSGKETMARLLSSHVSYIHLYFGSLQRSSNSMCFSTGDCPGRLTCRLVSRRAV